MNRWRILAIPVVLALAIGVELLPRTPVVVSPQLPHVFRVYVPLVNSNYRQSKKCVALGEGYYESGLRELGVRCTYVYWYNGTPAGASADIEIDAMIDTDSITVTGNAPYFMGYNEPDQVANISPAMAAEIWPAVIAANPGKLAVSPAPSHAHPEWLADFYAAHVARWGYPPKLDVLAIHCYEGASVCIRVVSQVIGYAERWGVGQVWVTEFAFTDAWQSAYPPGETWQSQARTFIAWMDAQPRITRYYWWSLTYDSDEPIEQYWGFGWYTQLYDWHTGQLNERGRFYQSIK